MFLYGATLSKLYEVFTWLITIQKQLKYVETSFLLSMN